MNDNLVGLIAVVLLFGGGTLFLLAISPVGKAIAGRILGKHTMPLDEDEVKEELKQLRAEVEELRLFRNEVSELAERVDFAERLLAQQKDPGALPPGGRG